MATNIPEVPNYTGDIALRSDPDNFPQNAEDQYSYLATLSTGLNSTVTAINTVATETEQTALSASTSADIAASNANFDGLWSTKTGAKTVPYSVSNNGRNWQLLVDIADITASEPLDGNADWQELTTGTSDLQAAALTVGCEYSQIIYSTDTTTVLDDILYIFVASEQVTYAKPIDVGIGEVIVSVVGGVLTTDVDTYALSSILINTRDFVFSDFYDMNSYGNFIVGDKVTSGITVWNVESISPNVFSPLGNVYISDFGNESSSNHENLVLAASYGAPVVFSSGSYDYSDVAYFPSGSDVKILTHGIVDITWSGVEAIVYSSGTGAAGMWDVDGLGSIDVRGEFTFSSIHGDTFSGPYIRTLGGRQYTEDLIFMDGIETITRNSSRTGNGQSGVGRCKHVNMKCKGTGNGPISYGFYPWWDEILNTTSLVIEDCELETSIRPYLASYTSRVSINGVDHSTKGGVCYQNNPRSWADDSRWFTTSGTFDTRNTNYLVTGGVSGAQISISLYNLGFANGDKAYIMFEGSCLVTGSTNTEASASIRNGGTTIGSNLNENKTIEFTVSSQYLSIFVAAGSTLRMRNSVIYKGGDLNNFNHPFVAYTNSYEVNGGQFRGMEWGATAGIDCRRVNFNNYTAIGCRRPVNFDVVSTAVTDGEYTQPDIMGGVFNSTFIACHDHAYITGKNMQLRGCTFQSVGHLSTRGCINVNAGNRSFPEVSQLSSSDIYIDGNTFINAKTRLGYISGGGRMYVGPSNIHDSDYTASSLWTPENTDGSQVTFTLSGRKDVKVISDDLERLDMSDSIQVVNNELGSQLTIDLPPNSTSRSMGGKVEVVNVKPNDAVNTVRFRALSGFGSVNGGVFLTWPTGSLMATVICINDSGDYWVSFSS